MTREQMERSQEFDSLASYLSVVGTEEFHFKINFLTTVFEGWKEMETIFVG